MPFSPKSSQRIIAAPERIKPSQLPRSVDTDKVSQFNLFENFTFSTSESHEGDVAACSTNYSKSMTNQVQKNGQLKSNWEEDMLPRFSNMNLQSASVSTIDPKAPDFVPYGKCIVPNNKSQQIFIADGRLYQGNPNGYQYVCGNHPAYYMVQSQGPYVEPWPVRNVQQFPNGGGIPIPTQFYVNHLDEHKNFYPTINYRTDMCNAINFNPNFHYQEAVPPIDFPKKDIAHQQIEEEALKNKIKNKAKSQQTTAKPLKPIKKIGFPKFPRRRNFTQEVQDENIFCSTTPNPPIPKGARPILSARK
ncbi:uncharacterized protein LOC122504590 [Leptopilina heterotoma]|uniref:uncharacterized protein LOC122504590 n=1 Tax=Leptopilina heterotoma TaxID=63436 RepID=UPI001CA826F0|nr:uncharacterized protein LOC122504590 [Leptopilina heterotoma]